MLYCPGMLVKQAFPGISIDRRGSFCANLVINAERQSADPIVSLIGRRKKQGQGRPKNFRTALPLIEGG